MAVNHELRKNLRIDWDIITLEWSIIHACMLPCYVPEYPIGFYTDCLDKLVIFFLMKGSRFTQEHSELSSLLEGYYLGSIK